MPCGVLFSTDFPQLWKLLARALFTFFGCGLYLRPAYNEDFDGMNSWEKILQHMERRVNPHSFATWFRPTRQEGTENGKLVVRVPSRIFRKRLTETYGELLQAVLVEVGMSELHLEFVCTENDPAPRGGKSIEANAPGFRFGRPSAESPLSIRDLCGGRVESIRSCGGAGGCRSSLPRPTTRCFSMAGWGWARRT